MAVVTVPGSTLTPATGDTLALGTQLQNQIATLLGNSALAVYQYTTPDTSTTLVSAPPVVPVTETALVLANTSSAAVSVSGYNIVSDQSSVSNTISISGGMLDLHQQGSGVGDVVYDTGNATVIAAGGGNTIVGSGSGYFLSQGSGNNVFVGNGNGSANFGSGNFSLNLSGSGSVTLTGGGGDGGVPVVNAGSGNDTLYAAPASSDILMVGGTGSGGVSMVGGSGTNVMVAGSGSDTFVGGSGSNSFNFFDQVTSVGGGQHDYVTNWTSSDQANFFGYSSSTTAESLLAAATSSGGNVTLTLSDGTSVTFVGVTASDLTGHINYGQN